MEFLTQSGRVVFLLGIMALAAASLRSQPSHPEVMMIKTTIEPWLYMPQEVAP